MSETTLSVSQITQAIGGALSMSFPEPVWVAGEIQGYDRDAAKASTRRWGQVYFELVEKAPGADAAKAAVKMLLWGDAARRIQAALGDTPLRDGVKVRLLCAVDFYWPRASLQLKVLEADPAFTLGDLEQARRALVEKLKAEGIYDENRGVEFPAVPLNVGVVTSDGSAAWHDFLDELRRSGYAFHVTLFDARMQGAESEDSVTAALGRLSADPAVDAIVLIRGGGSRSDLMWFDREKIARAVALCPKPVVTGIGHEIDTSVADLVAHTPRKTPTAAAQFLVEMVRAFDDSLASAARTTVQSVREILGGHARGLAESGARLRRGAPVFLSRAGEGLSAARRTFLLGAGRPLAVARERLAEAPRRVERSSRAALSSARERLASAARECDLKDPRRLLARGWSLLFAGDRLVKSAGAVSAGQDVSAHLADGKIKMRVTETLS